MSENKKINSEQQVEVVIYQKIGRVALIKLNQKPINAMGKVMRFELFNAFNKAQADTEIDALVIASNIGMFSGGADITEFSNADEVLAYPDLKTLINIIEASAKLVVIALESIAFGGGLELALAAHYRIAKQGTKISLPEIKLGLIPGAGGTQRLPRVAGIEIACEMILSGRAISAKRALSAGIFDKLVDDQLNDEAVKYACSLIDAKAPLIPTAQKHATCQKDVTEYIAEFSAALPKKSHQLKATSCALEAIEATTRLSMADGLLLEQKLFKRCMASAQARALIHLFFADKKAGKIDNISSQVTPAKINNVSVIGAGTMGSGIAMNFLNAGIPVVLVDRSAEQLEQAVERIKKQYQSAVKKKKIDQATSDHLTSLLSVTTDYCQLKNVDLAIEAVFEEMSVKQEVFKQLDLHCHPDCILASNTSTLDINEIAKATERPDKVIGLHFFSPANVMPLLEVVRCENTAESVLVSCMALAKRIKKVAVVVGVCFGFVGNRMLEPYAREGMRLLLEGASVEQIDQALEQFGMAMGLFTMADLAGLDISYAVRKGQPALSRGDSSYAAIADRLAELGRFGQKTARGFYHYQGREKLPDAEVAALSESLAHEFAVVRRQIEPQEIIERMLFSMINEAAFILEQGIAQRSSDCDLIYVYGYGFPAWRGGPLQYADELGVEHVLQRLMHYQTQLGEYGQRWFKPAPLLQQLANQQLSFAQYQRKF